MNVLLSNNIPRLYKIFRYIGIEVFLLLKFIHDAFHIHIGKGFSIYITSDDFHRYFIDTMARGDDNLIEPI